MDAVQHYLAVPLGSLGGVASRAFAINDRGAVTGTAETGSGGSRAFVHDGGVMRDLGDPWGATLSYGLAIGNGGHVAGYAIVPRDPIAQRNGDRAFVALPTGEVVALETSETLSSRAHGVNASGHVVGVATTVSSGVGRAFLQRDGLMIALGTLGGQNSAANAINAVGQITGSAQTAAGEEHAFLHSGGAMVDLGTLGGMKSVGTAVNARGDVAGYSETARPPFYGSERAFLHAEKVVDGGAVKVLSDLGTLGGSFSRARGVNASGVVVGESQNAGLVARAFVHSDGVMRDLNDVVASGLNDAVLTEAQAINDRGQIAANSCGPRSPLDCRAFRLDPLATPVAVEYYHAAYGHYFVTAFPPEIDALDAGLFDGWARTGLSFRTYPLGTAGTTRVCRFWSGATFTPKSSHYYGPRGSACELVMFNPDWVFEGDAFAMRLPDAAGTCGAGTEPLYQFFNNGRSGAPNHRYTTNADARRAMIAQGWTPEGAGVGVVGCVPIP